MTSNGSASVPPPQLPTKFLPVICSTVWHDEHAPSSSRWPFFAWSAVKTPEFTEAESAVVVLAWAVVVLGWAVVVLGWPVVALGWAVVVPACALKRAPAARPSVSEQIDAIAV